MTTTAAALSASSRVSHSMWPDWAIYLTLCTFSKPLATIILPKSPTFLGKFCKGTKILNFSSEIILGNFYRHLAIFLVTLLSLQNGLLLRKWRHPASINYYRLTKMRWLWFQNFHLDLLRTIIPNREPLPFGGLQTLRKTYFNGRIMAVKTKLDVSYDGKKFSETFALFAQLNASDSVHWIEKAFTRFA